METEQGVIDKFDDDVSDVLMTPTSPGAVPVTPPDRRRKLSRIQTGFDRIDEAITSEPDTLVECSLLTQFQEELHDYKKDVSLLYDQLTAMDISDDDELLATHSLLERRLSTTAHKVRRLLTVIRWHGSQAHSLETILGSVLGSVCSICP